MKHARGVGVEWDNAGLLKTMHDHLPGCRTVWSHMRSDGRHVDLSSVYMLMWRNVFSEGLRMHQRCFLNRSGPPKNLLGARKSVLCTPRRHMVACKHDSEKGCGQKDEKTEQKRPTRSLTATRTATCDWQETSLLQRSFQVFKRHAEPQGDRQGPHSFSTALVTSGAPPRPKGP